MQSPQESMVLMGVEDDVIAHARRLVAANKAKAQQEDRRKAALKRALREDRIARLEEQRSDPRVTTSHLDRVDVVWWEPQGLLGMPQELREVFENRARPAEIPDSRADTASDELRGLMRLPQELRDMIWRYTIPRDAPIKVRSFIKKIKIDELESYGIIFRQRLPAVYRAFSLLHDEIMKAHYRLNTIRFSAGMMDDNGCDLFGAWIWRGGATLTQHLRHLRISYDVYAYASRYTMYGWSRHQLMLDIRQKGEKSVVATLGRPQLHRRGPADPSVGLCVCKIETSIRNRLVQEDALHDPLCLLRIEQSTRHRPLIRFAIEAFEAIRLTQASTQAFRLLSPLQQHQFRRPSALCR